MKTYNSRDPPPLIPDQRTKQKQNAYERPEIIPDLPKGGVDIHDVPLYWDLPCGRNVCHSITQLCKLPDDELLPYDSDEAYMEIAKNFRFDILGTVAGEDPHKSFAEFREDLGCLHDERWKCLTWRQPDKESSPCWWLVNRHDEDRTQPPKLVSRSLACLRLELQQQRVATTSKIMHERETRSEQNSRAADVIHGNLAIWRLVGGPDPEALLTPTLEALALVTETCVHLEKLGGAHRDSSRWSWSVCRGNLARCQKSNEPGVACNQAGEVPRDPTRNVR